MLACFKGLTDMVIEIGMYSTTSPVNATTDKAVHVIDTSEPIAREKPAVADTLTDSPEVM